MNLVNLISSLKLESNRTALTFSIPNENVEFFMKYIQKFGVINSSVKTCDLHNVINPELMYTPATGIPEMDKIKTIKKIRECVTHLPNTYETQGLRVLKDFVEKNGSLKLDERAIQNMKEAGIEVNWVD